MADPKVARGNGAERGARARAPAVERPPPLVQQAALAKEGLKWITVPQESTFPAQGLPDLAPVVYQHPGVANLMSSSNHILSELGVDADSITLTHDADWDTYPEVGAAMKEAGGEEEGLCIAECAETGIWAVGAAAGWRKREQAARLAICVSLAANLEDFASLARSQSEFTAFCEAVGIQTGSEFQQPPDGFMPPVVAAPPKPAPVQQQEPPQEAVGGSGVTPPLWISLSGDDEVPPAPLDSLLTEALVVHHDGHFRKGLFNRADSVLAHYVAEFAGEVTIHDDPMWDKYPQVGKQVKEATSVEQCLCIAACAPAGVWAVGVAGKGKNRLSACKVALAATIALQNIEVGQDVDFKEFPAMQHLVEEATAARS